MTTATEHDVRVREKIYIGGEWVAPGGTGVLEVINATTEQVMGSVPEGTVEDVDAAVAAARAAFESWSQTSVQERADWMRRIAESLGARMEEIAELIAQEVGMPVKLSRASSRRACRPRRSARCPSCWASWSGRRGSATR